MTHKLVFDAGSVGHFYVVVGRTVMFELLTGEDIGSDKMDFVSLGGVYFSDFAGTTLDDNEAVFAQA